MLTLFMTQVLQQSSEVMCFLGLPRLPWAARSRLAALVITLSVSSAKWSSANWPPFRSLASVHAGSSIAQSDVLVACSLLLITVCVPRPAALLFLAMTAEWVRALRAAARESAEWSDRSSDQAEQLNKGFEGLEAAKVLCPTYGVSLLPERPWPALLLSFLLHHLRLLVHLLLQRHQLQRVAWQLSTAHRRVVFDGAHFISHALYAVTGSCTKHVKIKQIPSSIHRSAALLRFDGKCLRSCTA